MHPHAPQDAPRPSIMEDAGQKLKRVRERLRLKFRDVEEASARIAARHHNDEFIVALSRLADIENKGTMPSVYRLYSLCAIYRLDFNEVLTWYGVSLPELPADADVIQHARTHLVSFRADEGEIQVPLAIDPGLDLSRTVYLSRLIQRWGKLPLMLVNHLDLKNFRYGLIGTEDWSMFPIVPPGSLVVIDDTRRRIATGGWSTEFERPIYFLENRDGYCCGWCSLREGQLTVQPHPASMEDPEVFAYPSEIEVIGQVTRVAMSLGLTPPRANRP
ncbi:MAG TPA: helix-turn-helix transcriptional regulator [Bryobacteraceae bacterium]|nr:helix-turn-helix transcriptional regulator [Bryobacteraceae bacterium]